MSIIHARRLCLALKSSVFIALASTGCSGKPAQVTTRFRVTATIEENGVRRKGSAVWEQTLYRVFSLVGEYGGDFSGDAIPIVLSNGSVLLVMPKSWSTESPKREPSGYYPDAGNVPRLLFGKYIEYKGSDEIERLIAIKNLKNPFGHLVCDQPKPMTWQLPERPGVQAAYKCFRIAIVKNPKNKSTLDVMDTGKVYYDKTANINIIGMTVELTNDSLDRPLTRFLPWLSQGPDLTTPEGWRQSQLTETNPIVHGIRR